ncbi:dihydrodipicolinate synthase family protein [Paenibacillus sp. J5C_2022]|uniref:dihydrodipicolinate synthase family protein n=1 Tax=Paenibacillus sp. J5C2022 TaxID=2977129 RepID=UPI0021D055CD|nr:dihydrodipicolinate synthase family protein [Paenibacillus sp. J5C2022]MCU6713235.1 dihydrodipicolinate synthase family protein [Paenibacillus sp. J5C2022]
MSNEQKERFKGVIVAMNSCYDAHGEVNTEAAKALARFLISKGVNGLYVGGSTGEGLLQSIEERQAILEAVIEAVGGAASVIAHVGALNTRDSIKLAIHAESAGADALSAVAPFYYGYNPDSVGKHWSSIADSTSLPFIIYHIPSTTGFSLTTNLLRELKRNPKIIGVKTTSPSSYELQQFKTVGGEDFLLFNGPDEQYLAGRIMGADAAIGGTYGIMPELFVRLEELYASGQLEQARNLQFRINDIITDLLQLPIYAALKELVRRRGIDCGEVRAPLPTLNQEHMPLVEAVYEKVMSAIAQLTPAHPRT